MKKLYLKTACLILSLLMCLTAFAGCRKSKDDKKSATDVTTVNTEDEYYLNTLPKELYDYKEMTVATIDSNCVSDKYLDKSDPVDAKKFERDSVIKEYFGVTMNYFEVPMGNDSDEVKYMLTAINAGDCNWDVIIQQPDNLMKLAINGCTVDLNQVENLHLEKEWWSQSMNKNLTFNDSLYIMAGPIAEWYYGAATALAFNVDMMKDNNFPDLYSLVVENKWTLECMKKICADYGADPTQDKYAVSFSSGVAPYGLFPSAGGTFSTFDKNGNILVDLGNEKTVNILEKILEIYNSDTTFYGNITESSGKFIQKKALFYYSTVGYMEIYLPTSDVAYGIVPCPKMNESDKYVSCAWPSSGYCAAIPTTVSEERQGFAGLIMDAYCFLGYDIIKPVKYDSIVKYRVATDEQSSDILDMIFGNLYFDLNLVMNLGGSRALINETILNGMGRYTSAYEAIEPYIKKDISDYNNLTKGE